MDNLFQLIVANGVDEAFRYQPVQIPQYEYTQLAGRLYQEGYALQSISVLKRALIIYPGNQYLVKSIIPKIYQVILKPFYTEGSYSEQTYLATIRYIDGLLSAEQRKNYFYIYDKHVEYLSSKTNREKEEALRCLETFDGNQLDQQPYRQDDKSFPSSYEKWLKKKVDLQFDLKLFEACVNTVERALPIQWHYNNDVWIKRSKARSLLELAREKEAITIYKELLLKHPTWFMYHELAKIYQRTGQREEALLFAAKGCLRSDADPSKCFNLYQTMYELLQTEDESSYEAFLHLAFYIKMRKENDYEVSSEVNHTFERLQLKYKEPNHLKKELEKCWTSIAYKQAEKRVGIIQSISANKKAGFIEYDSKKRIYFKMSNVKFSRKFVKEGKKVSFIIEDSFDVAKNRPSKIATFICEMKEGEGK